MRIRFFEFFPRPLAALMLAAGPVAFAQDAGVEADGNAPPPPGPEAVEEFELMVVTGTATARALKETAVRTQVFGSAELEQVQVTRLSDALDYTPGLRVETTCQNCNSTEIQMLGLQQRYISILSDGIPNFTGLAAVYGLDQIPTSMVDRIEVVKGGGSTLYGPNAVAGVINVIPKDPEVTGGEVTARYDYLDGQAGAGQPIGNAVVHLVAPEAGLGVSIYGVRNFQAPVDVNNDGFTELARLDLWGGGFRGFWTPDDTTKLVVDYLMTREERRGGSNDLDSAPNTVELAEEITTRRQVLTTTWTHETGDSTDYRLTYSVSDIRRDSYYGGTVPLGRRGDPGWTPELGFGNTDNRLHFIDSAFNWRPGEGHILTIGAQYRNETIDDEQTGVGRVISDRYENLGVMLQHDWTPSAMWNLVYGARVDFHSEVDDPVLSPRVAVKFSPREDFRVRAAAATGFRAPEIFDEDLHIENIGGKLQTVTLDPGLEPERSYSFSLAPEWDISSRARAEANLFYSRLRNTFINTETDNPATESVLEFTKRNGGDLDTFGGELSLFFDLRPFTLDLSYTEQRGRFRDAELLLGEPGDAVDNAIFTSRAVRLPDRFGVARLACDTGWAEFWAAGRLTGPMLVPHIVTSQSGEFVENRLVRTRAFFAVDAGVTKRWDIGGGMVLTANLGVRNILNAFQDDLDRGAFRDPTYVYGPRQPRLFYTGLTLAF
jgi:outer membrane receptor for ferrienterochelin and colicins